ncbi:MAG: hypothetical protein NC311_11520 [Muribaculaceae bacterium]|nr:hypothetical protein [Muribaculaceae bacterium]
MMIGKITKEQRELFKTLLDKEGYELGLEEITKALKKSKKFSSLRKKLGETVVDEVAYSNTTDLVCEFEPAEYSGDDDRQWTSVRVIITWNHGNPEDPDNQEEGYLNRAILDVYDEEKKLLMHLCSFNAKTLSVTEWLDEPALDADGNPITFEDEPFIPEARTKEEAKRLRKAFQKRIRKPKAPAGMMNKYLVYSWEGGGYSPDGHPNDLGQILGCVAAISSQAARNRFLRDNPWVTDQGFDPEELSVIRLHDEVDLDTVFND